MHQKEEVCPKNVLWLRFWHHLQFIEILRELHFKYPIFKENKNMKYVTRKDLKHTRY